MGDCVCVCVCVCVHTYLYMYTHTHTRTHTFAYTKHMQEIKHKPTSHPHNNERMNMVVWQNCNWHGEIKALG